MSAVSRRGGWKYFVVTAVSGLVLAACGSSNDAGPTTTTTANTFGRPYGFEAAKAATTKAYASTEMSVDTTSRPAAKDKHIAVISSGQSVLGHQLTSDAAVAAAKAAGWKVDLLDGKLNPATYGEMIRQAMTSGVDGIILEGMDCNLVAQPLREAKTRKIPVVGLGALDCDDPLLNAGDPLYSAVDNFGVPAKDNGVFTEAYGRDQANYIMTDSNNSAHVLMLNDLEIALLQYSTKGFKDQMEHSGGSGTVDELDFKAADIGPTLVQEIQAELLKHPEITWIRSSFSFATLGGVVPAIAAQPGKYKVLGGEGLPPEIDLVRQGAVTAVLYLDTPRLAWSAVDNMNSVFRSESTKASGVGWILVDKTHNLPATGQPTSSFDYQAAYKKAWGITS